MMSDQGTKQMTKLKTINKLSPATVRTENVGDWKRNPMTPEGRVETTLNGVEAEPSGVSKGNGPNSRPGRS